MGTIGIDTFKISMTVYVDCNGSSLNKDIVVASSNCGTQNLGQSISADIGYYNMALFNNSSRLYYSENNKNGIINFKVTQPIKAVIEFVQTEKDFSCSVFDSFNIDIFKLQDLDIQAPEIVCFGDTLNLTSAFDSIKWNLPFASKSGKEVDFIINDSKLNNRNLLVTVNAKDENNCVYDSTFGVFVKSLPRVNFLIEQKYFRDSIFSAINLCDTLPNATYQWQIGNPVFKTYRGFEPLMRIDSEGSFPIKLTVTDSFFSCKNSLEKSINIVPNSIAKTYINSFKLYPNPAHNQIVVTSNIGQIEKAILYNGNGEQLEILTPNALDFSISLVNYTPGLYFIKVVSQSGSFNASFLVQ